MKYNYIFARSIEEMDEIKKALEENNNKGLALMTQAMWEEHMHNERDYKATASQGNFRLNLLNENRNPNQTQ